MTVPTCGRCGKVSVRSPCTKCRKEIYWKPQFRVKCIICGQISITTDEKWLKEQYKCRRCR